MPPCRSGASRRTKSPSVSGSPRLHSLFVNWGKQRRQNWQCLRSCLDKQILISIPPDKYGSEGISMYPNKTSRECANNPSSYMHEAFL